MRPINKKRILSIVFIAISLASLAYAVIMIRAFPRWLVDDAFIIFRYAENLAERGELNWNPGENPTEGYTGIALPWLLSLAIKLGIPPIIATHLIGVSSYFLGAVLIVLILRGFNLGSAVALALYFTAPFLYIHAWSGLETTMFVTAVLFAIFTFTRSYKRLFVLSLLLLSAARPEGVLLSILLLAVFRPFSLETALLYIIPCAIYFVCRWAYYGRLLPNTFYAKTAGGLNTAAAKNLRYFSLKYMKLPALLAIIYTSWQSIKNHRRLISSIALFAGASIAVYSSSNLTMNFYYRFLVPLYPLLLLTVGANLSNAKIDAKVVILAALLIPPQIRTNINRDVMKKERTYASSHYRLLKDEHIKIGKLLNEKMPPTEWLVVYRDAGAIPYYSKLKTVDFGGLNDEYLTGEDLTPEDMRDYFYSTNPGAIAITSRSRETIDHGPEIRGITKDKRLRNYALVKIYSSGERREYHEFLFIRKDLAGLAGIDKRNISTYQPRAREKRSSSFSHRERLPEDERARITVPKKHEVDSRSGHAATKAVNPAYGLWDKAQEENDPLVKIDLLRKLAVDHPNHEYAPQALFMIGFTYAEELNDTAGARGAFDELIRKHPNAEITGSARWMLESLGRPGPELN